MEQQSDDELYYEVLETEIADQFERYRKKVSRIEIRKELVQKSYNEEEVKYIMRQLTALEDDRLARGRKIMQGITVSATAAGLLLGGLFFIFVKPLFPTVVEVIEDGVRHVKYVSLGFWSFVPYIMLFAALVIGIRGIIIFKEIRMGDNKIDAGAGEAPTFLRPPNVTRHL